VRVSVRKSDLGSAHPELVVDGFNVAPETIRAVTKRFLRGNCYRL